MYSKIQSIELQEDLKLQEIVDRKVVVPKSKSYSPGNNAARKLLLVVNSLMLGLGIGAIATLYYLRYYSKWSTEMDTTVYIVLGALSSFAVVLSVLGLVASWYRQLILLSFYNKILGILIFFQLIITVVLGTTNQSLQLIIKNGENASHPAVGGKLVKHTEAFLKSQFDDFYSQGNQSNLSAWFVEWVDTTCLNNETTTMELWDIPKFPFPWSKENSNTSSFSNNNNFSFLSPNISKFEECKLPIAYAVEMWLYAAVLMSVGLLCFEMFLFILAKYLYSSDPNKPNQRDLPYVPGKKSLQIVKNYNLFLCLIGIGMIVLGSYLLNGEWGIFFQRNIMIGLIVTGALVVLSSWMGILGVIYSNRLLLQLYFATLFIAFFLQLIVTIILCGIANVLSEIIRGDSVEDLGEGQEIYEYLKIGYDKIFHLKGSVGEYFKSWVQENCSSSDLSFEQCKVSLSEALLIYIQPLAFFCLLTLFVQGFLVVNSYIVIITIPKKPRKHDKKKVVVQRKYSLKEALDIYIQVVPPKRMAEAQEEFKEAWREQTGIEEWNSSKTIIEEQFEAIVRKLILQRLMVYGHLDISLSISSNGKQVYCKIYASENVLALQAHRIHYPLQLKNEIDPGLEYWKEKAHRDEERELYTRKDALERLSLLSSANFIPFFDNRIHEGEMDILWSLRLHVHNRTMKLVRKALVVNNAYPTYAPYSKQARHQYLYKRYPNKIEEGSRKKGPSMFRSVDSLVLLQSIFAEHYDFQVCRELGLLEQCIPLHSCSKYDPINVQDLSKMWITFWKPEVLDGELPITNVLHHFKRLNPFRQPISAIRDYFGEKIALYFACLGFYSKCLVVPACVSGLLWFLKGNFHSIDPNTLTSFNEGKLHWTSIFFFSFTVLWAIAFIKMWTFKNQQLAIQWGKVGQEQEEKIRPQFHGKPQICPISYTTVYYYPTYRRILWKILSMLIIAFFIVVVIVIVLSICYVQTHLIRFIGATWGTLSTSAFQAIFIQLNSWIFSKVSRHLNDWENYRTETDYDDELIFKIFFFQIFNNYSALLITCFIKKNIFGCSRIAHGMRTKYLPNEPGLGNCMHELESLLTVIFIARVCLNTFEIGLPWIQKYVAKGYVHQQNEHCRSLTLRRDPELSRNVAYEVKLNHYTNPYDSYSQLVLQFGLVLLFVGAYPLAPILALIESTLEIRINAFKMCCLLQRPFPQESADIEIWKIYITRLVRVSILTNTGIYVYTTDNFFQSSKSEKFMIFSTIAFLFLMIVEILLVLLPDETSILKDIFKRQEFIRKKYYKGAVDYDDYKNTKNISNPTQPSLMSHLLSQHDEQLPGKQKQHDGQPPGKQYNEQPEKQYNEQPPEKQYNEQPPEKQYNEQLEKKSLLGRLNKVYHSKPPVEKVDKLKPKIQLPGQKSPRLLQNHPKPKENLLSNPIPIPPPEIFQRTELAGMDAILEAVRRSEGSVESFSHLPFVSTTPQQSDCLQAGRSQSYHNTNIESTTSSSSQEPKTSSSAQESTTSSSAQERTLKVSSDHLFDVV